MEQIKVKFITNMERLQNVELPKSPGLEDYSFLIYQIGDNAYTYAIGPRSDIFESMMREAIQGPGKTTYMISDIAGPDFEHMEPRTVGEFTQSKKG